MRLYKRQLGFCFTILLLIISQNGFAVDLATLQKSAVENRDVIKRYQTNLERSEQEITRVRGPYLPSLDVGYTMNALDEPTFFESRESSVSYGAVSWNLFSGFRVKYNVESAVLQREVEKHNLNGILQDIQLNVSLGYLLVSKRPDPIQPFPFLWDNPRGA